MVQCELEEGEVGEIAIDEGDSVVIKIEFFWEGDQER